MAWEKCDVVVSGDTVKGGINSRDDSIRIQTPFVEGVSVGDSVSVDGATYQITSVDNVGDRNEILSMEVTNGKQVSGRTRSRAKREEIQDTDDS